MRPDGPGEALGITLNGMVWIRLRPPKPEHVTLRLLDPHNGILNLGPQSPNMPKPSPRKPIIVLGGLRVKRVLN